MAPNNNTTILQCGACDRKMAVPNEDIRQKAFELRDRGGVCKPCFAKGLKPKVVARPKAGRIVRDANSEVTVTCANNACRKGVEITPERKFVRNGETIVLPESKREVKARITLKRSEVTSDTTCSKECAKLRKAVVAKAAKAAKASK